MRTSTRGLMPPERVLNTAARIKYNLDCHEDEIGALRTRVHMLEEKFGALAELFGVLDGRVNQLSLDLGPK